MDSVENRAFNILITKADRSQVSTRGAEKRDRSRYGTFS